VTDPTTPRTPYPAVPRYGEGAPGADLTPPVVPTPVVPAPVVPAPVVPTPTDAPAAPTSAPARRGVGVGLVLALAWNLVPLVGVLAFGWPAGNVLVLFWVENAVLGLCTLVKVVTARGPAGTITVNGRPRPGTPALWALFFALHYGIFCLVHAAFTGIVAYRIGLDTGFWLLGMPVVLLAVRYAVETATSWFGPGGQRETVTPGRAMVQPYPRIIVLHLAVLLSFGLVIGGADAVPPWLADLTAGLPAAWRSPGYAVVVLLLVLKTAVDLVTTRWALRRR
jgi:hypothetical protein